MFPLPEDTSRYSLFIVREAGKKRLSELGSISPLNWSFR